MPFAHDCDRRFFADLGYDGESHFAFLKVKNGIRSVPLRKYRLLLRNGQNLPALPHGRKESVGVESAVFLGCQRGSHLLSPISIVPRDEPIHTSHGLIPCSLALAQQVLQEWSLLSSLALPPASEWE